MTDIAIKNQLEALKITTTQALKSKEASLQLLAKLGLSINTSERQTQVTTVKTVTKLRAS